MILTLLCFSIQEYLNRIKKIKKATLSKNYFIDFEFLKPKNNNNSESPNTIKFSLLFISYSLSWIWAQNIFIFIHNSK